MKQPFFATFLALAFCPLAVQAQDVYWTGTTGSWDTPANWSGTAVPTSVDDVFINSGTAQLGAGVSGNGNFLKVGNEAGQSGMLSITGGVLNTRVGFLGLPVGSVGTVLLSSGTWSNTGGPLHVGYYGIGNVTVSGGHLTSAGAIIGNSLGGSGTVTVTGGTWNITTSFDIGLGGTGSLLVDGGYVTVARDVGIGVGAGSSGTATVNSGTLRVGGGISVGDGAGTLRLTGGVLETTGITGGSNLSFRMAGGTLRALGNNANFVTGGFSYGVTLLGEAVIDSNGFNIGISSVFSDTAGLTKLGSGTLTLTGANEYRGGTSINGGAISISQNANLGHASGALSFSFGTLTTTAGFTMNRATTIGGPGGYFNVTTGTLTQQGAISGNGPLHKIGAGTLLLTGASTYNHDTYVNGGTLMVGVGGSIVNAGDLYLGNDFISSGAEFVLDGGSVSLDELKIARVRPGSVTVNSGTLVVDWDVQMSGNGAAVTLNGGRIQSNGVTFDRGSGSKTINVTGGRWDNGFLDEFAVEGSGNNVLNVSGGVLNTYYLNIGSGVFDQGTVSITGGTVAVTSWTTVGGGNAGTLTVSGSGVLSSDEIRVNANGLLNIGNANLTTTAFAPAVNSISLSSGTASFNHTNALILSVPISGDGVVFQRGSGTTTLSGTNSYTGGTTVTAGTLTRSGSAGFVNNTNYTVHGGLLDLNNFNLTASSFSGTGGRVNVGSGTLTVNQSGTTSYAGAILGTGGLIKQGAGTFTLTGSHSYTGATTISGGKLAVNGSLANTAVTVGNGGTLGGSGRIGGSVVAQDGSTIAAGNSVGTLTISGGFTFESGSLFSVEGDGAFFDRIDIGGAATIASGAEISFTLLTAPTEVSYTLLTAASGLDGSVQFSLVGSVPTGYRLVYSGTSLMLVNQATIGAVTVTPTDTTIITGGTTSVTVTVENSAGTGGQDLNATVTGTGSITGTGTTTVAAGATGTAAPDLAFSSTTVGTQTGTVTVTDPDASNNPQTGTTSVTVLDHAAPTLTITGGNSQSVITGATGVTATLNLANGTSGDSDRSPMDVQNLSSGLSGTTGGGVVASGTSADYTATLDTGTVGAGQSQVFSLDAGDQQTLAGANPLTTQSSTVTLNVYGHADPTISGTTFNLGNLHVGYSATTSNIQTVTNGTAGAYIVDLKTSATTSGNITVNGLSGISAGNSGTIAATLATGQGVGAINENLTYNYADDSSLAGASSNVGTSTLNITGLVYSGQGVWTSTAGGTWGTLTTDFGVNWQIDGGTPGLDAAFADTDTALFGTLGSGTVTLDGSAPSLLGVTFDNGSNSYTLAQGSGTSALTLNGGVSGTSTLTNAAGNHSIEIPLVLATDVQVSVTNVLDTLSISGLISGTGAVHVGGSGQVVYTQDQTYTGATVVNGGVLATQDLASSVALNGGFFSPGGLGTASTITVGALALNGGSLLFDIGTGVSDRIIINNGLGELNAATDFALNDIGATTGTYLVVQGLTPGWDLSLLSFTGLSSNWTGKFLLSDDETELYLSLYSGGPVSGPLLQNSAPVGIPTTADFFVEGSAQTSGPTQSNTVNSLTFLPNSLLTVFNTLTVTSGNLTVGSGSATLNGSGQLVAPNGLTKLGAGLLNLLNSILVNGTSTIAEGTLAINGAITTNDLIVQFGAWLKGNGQIFGNVINNGTVAPGNSPGTLTINGNFTQMSMGTLEIEIASLSNFDRLVVSGNANLAGTLNVVPFGGFNLKYGQQFAFLQAGSISGDFDSIMMPNPSIFRGRFLANGGTGTLIIAPTSYTLVAETQNQTNVAAALDSFISAKSGDRETVSIALDLQIAEQYPAAFEAISPAYYETLTDTTIELAVAQSQMIAQRLSAVRLGARGFNAVGIEAPLAHDRDGKGVMDAKDGKNFLAPTVDNKWGVWVQGNGIFAKTTATNMLPNYRSENGGFFVGADYAWNEGFTTGVFTGYQGTYSKYANGSSSSINSALFGGYATYQKGGFYSDAIITGGYNGYIAKRSIEFSTVNRTARSNPNGGQLTTYLDAGYDWNAKGFTFGPLASVQYTYAGVAPFTETGADSLDLRVQQQNANSLRTNLGGRIAYTWNLTDKIVIIPEVRMFWQHEFLQNSVDIGASLDGGNGPGFDYATTVPDRDSIFAAAGVSAVFNKNFSGYIYYNSNFARSDYMSQMISTGFNWKF